MDMVGLYFAFSVCVVQETGPSSFFTEEAPSQRNTEYILYSLSPLGLRKNVLWSTSEHSSWLSWMCPLCTAAMNWVGVIEEQKGFGGEQGSEWEGIMSAVLILLLWDSTTPVQSILWSCWGEQHKLHCHSFLLNTTAWSYVWEKTRTRVQTSRLESGERDATAYEGVTSISVDYCSLWNAVTCRMMCLLLWLSPASPVSCCHEGMWKPGEPLKAARGVCRTGMDCWASRHFHIDPVVRSSLLKIRAGET